MSRERLDPSLGNSDYLVLTRRRLKFSEWLERVPGKSLNVLDVGGRIQPYRALLQDRVETYMAVDPLPTALVNVIAVGESLPFADATFDVVLCTQVLCYSADPNRFVAEICRVLRPGGTFLFSVPAFFPFHAPNDRWRFSPDRIRLLLSGFSNIEVIPEDYSVAGLCRLIATFSTFGSEDWNWRLQKIVSVFNSATNLVGKYLDWASNGDTRFTTNYSVFAKKLPQPANP